MDTCKTIKVQPWGKDQGDYVEINEEDFDEKVHKKLTEAQIAKIEKAESDPLDHDGDGRKGGSKPAAKDA